MALRLLVRRAPCTLRKAFVYSNYPAIHHNIPRCSSSSTSSPVGSTWGASRFKRGNFPSKGFIDDGTPLYSLHHLKCGAPPIIISRRPQTDHDALSCARFAVNLIKKFEKRNIELKRVVGSALSVDTMIYEITLEATPGGKVRKFYRARVHDGVKQSRTMELLDWYEWRPTRETLESLDVSDGEEDEEEEKEDCGVQRMM